MWTCAECNENNANKAQECWKCGSNPPLKAMKQELTNVGKSELECAHLPCRCHAPVVGECCSEYCEQVGEDLEMECRCLHLECKLLAEESQEVEH